MSHGGRRAGAGRPAGTGWLPAVTEMRVAAAEKMSQIVGSDRDPLAVVLAVACNEELDVQTRLGACSIVLPYIYPRLSATQVAATHTVTKIDGNDLLRRLDERLARLHPPAPTLEIATSDTGLSGE